MNEICYLLARVYLCSKIRHENNIHVARNSPFSARWLHSSAQPAHHRRSLPVQLYLPPHILLGLQILWQVSLPVPVWIGLRTLVYIIEKPIEELKYWPVPWEINAQFSYCPILPSDFGNLAKRVFRMLEVECLGEKNMSVYRAKDIINAQACNRWVCHDTYYHAMTFWNVPPFENHFLRAQMRTISLDSFFCIFLSL